MDGSHAESSTAETAPGASVSSPRYFWVGMAVFLIVIVFLGFGSTYGRQLVMGQDISGAGVVETDWVIHLHTAVFVGWMLFLLVQTLLIARGRTRAHMAFGRYGGLALGGAVLVVGSLIAGVQAQAFVSAGHFTWAEWRHVLFATRLSSFGLLGFVVLGGLGLLYRRRPEAHKRYMILATIMLVTAATSRMDYLLGAWDNAVGFSLLLAPLFVYDLYLEGRLRPATLVGSGFVGVLLILEYL